MKFFVLALILFSSSAYAKKTTCTCTCVTKGENGKYTTETATGKTREAAGEALKKALGKKKCEISPTCEGKCTLD